jgi:hypothetical protein
MANTHNLDTKPGFEVAKIDLRRDSSHGAETLASLFDLEAQFRGQQPLRFQIEIRARRYRLCTQNLQRLRICAA